VFSSDEFTPCKHGNECLSALAMWISVHVKCDGYNFHVLVAHANWPVAASSTLHIPHVISTHRSYANALSTFFWLCCLWCFDSALYAGVIREISSGLDGDCAAVFMISSWSENLELVVCHRVWLRWRYFRNSGWVQESALRRWGREAEWAACTTWTCWAADYYSMARAVHCIDDTARRL
jgi:hypothetical protein